MDHNGNVGGELAEFLVRFAVNLAIGANLDNCARGCRQVGKGEVLGDVAPLAQEADTPSILLGNFEGDIDATIW